MKSLLGHLVETKLVEKEKAISVSIDLISNTKSLLEIIFRNQLIPTEQLYEALELQQRTHVDLKLACEKLSYWTDDVQKKVLQELQKQNGNIVTFLLKDEIVTLEELTKAYDEYIRLVTSEKASVFEENNNSSGLSNGNSNNSANSEEKKLSLLDAINNEIAAKIKSAEERIKDVTQDLEEIELNSEPMPDLQKVNEGVESAKENTNVHPLRADSSEFNYDFSKEYPLPEGDREAFCEKYEFESVIQETLDAGLIFDYFEVLNDDNLSDLENLILAVEVANEEEDLLVINDKLREIYRMLHTFKGSSRFIKAHLVEKVIHYGENVLEICQRFVEQVSTAEIDKLVSCLLRVLDNIRTINLSIDEFGSEMDFWNSDERKLQYLDAIYNFELFLDYLNKKDMKVDLDQLEEAF